MDHIDKQLLNIIQKDFPLVKSPFKLLGDQVGLSESETINKIVDLKCNKNIIRNISAIFNTKLLGITSVLVAIKVINCYLPDVIGFINNNRFVSHNYIRDCEYNIWFTLSMGDIDQINLWINTLKSRFNIENVLILQSIKQFKRNVFFNFFPDQTDDNYFEMDESTKIELSDTDKLILSLLEKDLPINKSPFASLAEEVNLEENYFIAQATNFKTNKIIKRYAAVLRHNNAGFTYNALLAWDIDDSQVEKIGIEFSLQNFVSHCYQRVRLKDWKYNIYTMIHAISEEKLLEYKDILVNIAYPSPYLVLKTVQELKKERVKYFCIH